VDVFCLTVAITVCVCVWSVRERCRRLGGAELPLRELKPLRADTYDSTVDTVYARNNAFNAQPQPHATPAPSAGGTGSTRLTENDVCEYEYVARDGGQTVGHTENRPDLARRRSSGHSSGHCSGQCDVVSTTEQTGPCASWRCPQLPVWRDCSPV